VNLSVHHPNYDQLAAFLWGQLQEAEQEVIESHLAGCAACCQILREVPDDRFLNRLRIANNPRLAEGRGNPAPDHALPKELRHHPRYKIGRFLGSGGMGFVYQAYHRLMERSVAIKIIHRDLVWHSRAVERFRQEVKAAARLSHPNIVTAFDAEQAGGIHFLVMELVNGISLARLVERRGPRGVAHACNYVRQAAQGLQHAFENGMVHRDIKPHNLMLTRKGQIKILDFGLALLARESSSDPDLIISQGTPTLTSSGDIVGTPDFMAPEQRLDPRQVDIRADLYSLGCTLFFLLAGKAPFVQAKGFRQRNGQPQPLTAAHEDLPQGLIELLNKMMAQEPANRFQTPVEVVKALASFARPAGVSAREPKKELVASAAEEFSGATSKLGSAVSFLARCSFCPTKIRVPNYAWGASVRCPRCGNYYTAAPED
jgi:eukaryotic-like serine/threonine-protein kinase